jgi:hypothetical protein
MIGQPLPPPTTFAEGQRLVYGWLVAAAGMFCGAMAIGLIVIFVWGGWPATLYGQIITILGCSLGGFIAAMIFVIVGLLVGGPVGRFKGSVSKDGATVEAESGGGDAGDAAA